MLYVLHHRIVITSQAANEGDDWEKIRNNWTTACTEIAAKVTKQASLRDRDLPKLTRQLHRWYLGRKRVEKDFEITEYELVIADPDTNEPLVIIDLPANTFSKTAR